MRTTIGSKVTQPMPPAAGGLKWPAIAVSEEYSDEVIVKDRQTGEDVTITVTRNDFISLRETKDGVPYTAFTSEVVMYGRKPVCTPRFDYVVGLDVAPEGHRLSLDTVMKTHEESYAAFQATFADAPQGVVSAKDL